MKTAQDFHTLATIIQLAGPVVADVNVSKEVKESAQKVMIKAFDLILESFTESSARNAGIIM